jgi:hypothetical protein
MIIRSQIWSESEAVQVPTTIDIEFWGVDYLDILTDFKSMDIQIDTFNDCPKLLIHKSNGSKVFKIISEQAICYVVAAGCVVGKSNWMSEDRLTNFYLNYDEVLMKF